MTKCKECTKTAYFNVVGQKKGLYCATHKMGIMVNVVDKRCLYTGCQKRAIFNEPGQKSRAYCDDHRTPTMVNMAAKRCDHPGCYVTPIYNVPDAAKAAYCIDHKSDEMVNILGKKCEHPECITIAQFNEPGEKSGKFCSSHRTSTMHDVKHKKCEYEGCIKSPSYMLLEDTQPRFCASHKTEEMIDGKHNKCISPGCKIKPIYNQPGEVKAIYCSDHKTGTMVDVFHKKCTSTWCLTRANPKYEDYCVFCYTNIYPDKQIMLNYKTKEKSVVDAVVSTFPDVSWVSDKRVINGCSKRRPDLLLDLGYQVIVVEVDENQYNAYDCSCENKRLMELSQDVGHRPIVFVRFNPDAYINCHNQMVASCWCINNKTGILYVNKHKQAEWAIRLESLKMQIQYWLNNATSKTVEIIQLYYDGME